eukprot:scaffold267280_cov30-Tisochrysis_lutea.AAC.5
MPAPWVNWCPCPPINLGWPADASLYARARGETLVAAFCVRKAAAKEQATPYNGAFGGRCEHMLSRAGATCLPINARLGVGDAKINERHRVVLDGSEEGHRPHSVDREAHHLYAVGPGREVRAEAERRVRVRYVVLEYPRRVLASRRWDGKLEADPGLADASSFVCGPRVLGASTPVDEEPPTRRPRAHVKVGHVVGPVRLVSGRTAVASTVDVAGGLGLDIGAESGIKDIVAECHTPSLADLDADVVADADHATLEEGPLPVHADVKNANGGPVVIAADAASPQGHARHLEYTDILDVAHDTERARPSLHRTASGTAALRRSQCRRSGCRG